MTSGVRATCDAVATAGHGSSNAITETDPWLRGRWRYHTVILASACTVLIAAMIMDLQGDRRVVLPWLGPLPGSCAWQNLLAMNCPGCGLTRCFVALAHGRLIQAWHFNPAGLLLFAVILYQVPFRAAQLWRLSRGQLDVRHGTWTIHIAIWACVAALLGQWVWRHLL